MKRNHQFILLALISVFMLVFAPPGLATAETGAPVCAGGISPQGVCGDGVCDSYEGENKNNCPSDCDKTVVQPTVPPLTSTPTATSTLPVLPLIRPSSTPTGTLTPENPSTTEVSIPTATVQPTPGESTTVSALEGQCGLVSYESRPLGWQKAYKGSSNNFIPQADEDQEVYVCDVPPDGQICIPMYQGLMSAAQGRVEQITLVDCGSDGTCRTHQAKIQRVGSNMCATVSGADNLSCATGCAFLPAQATFMGILVPPFLRDLADNPVAIPAICLAAILLVGFVGLLIFARRRRRGDGGPVEQTAGVESV